MREKENNVTVREIAECVRSATEMFAPQGEIPRTWHRATSSTWLACSRQKAKRSQSTCLRCGRSRHYGLKSYCEQCDRHVRVIRRKAQRRNQIRPTSTNSYK